MTFCKSSWYLLCILRIDCLSISMVWVAVLSFHMSLSVITSTNLLWAIQRGNQFSCENVHKELYGAVTFYPAHNAQEILMRAECTQVVVFRPYTSRLCCRFTVRGWEYVWVLYCVTLHKVFESRRTPFAHTSRRFSLVLRDSRTVLWFKSSSWSRLVERGGIFWCFFF